MRPSAFANGNSDRFYCDPTCHYTSMRPSAFANGNPMSEKYDVFRITLQ